MNVYSTILRVALFPICCSVVDRAGGCVCVSRSGGGRGACVSEGVALRFGRKVGISFKVGPPRDDPTSLDLIRAVAMHVPVEDTRATPKWRFICEVAHVRQYAIVFESS